ncbi:hypothetical protein BGZ65_006888 [Modicella reniformis]|uniref:Uncharacterized protein n=1 Tax=Modicella reniformis TaxID=1440133 RepID=A0A9P6MFY3_9FUNG|nr:hypothetical protein BGZ65_006888 [Modicella reniformis]
MLRATRTRADDRRAIVVIGDGDFRSRGGGHVKCNKFTSRLYDQAKGEGMLACYVDEFRTSIFCCKCHQRMQTKGRSVVCPDPTCGGRRSVEYDKARNLDPKTGLQRDRDHNTAQNMSNAALQWVQDFKPESLDRRLAKEQ